MKTSDLIKLLEDNGNHHLEFELEPEQFVSPTFHITEIKNVTIESVDCGGNPDTYYQTIIQLWVNPKEEFRTPWSASKAMSIFKQVDKVKPINGDAEILFEFGDATRRTSNYSVENVQITGDHILIQLYAQPTVCKPSLAASGASACC